MLKMTNVNWEVVDRAADAAGIPYFTRKKWRERSNIPSHHWTALIRSSDGELSADELLAMFEQPKPERKGKRQ